MNYNVISQFLDNGFDSDQLIALLMKNAPNLGNKIKKLLVGGWGTNEILSYIQKDPETSKINLRNAKPASPEEIASLQAYKAKRGSDKSRDEQAIEDLTKFTKNTLKIGGAVALPYLGGRALQGGVGALESMINPNQSTPSAPATTPNITQPGPNIGQQIGQQAAAPVAQAIQPTQNIPTPPMNQASPLPQGVMNKIEELRKSGNNPQQIAGYFRTFNPSQTEKFEKQAGKKIEELVDDYIKTAPPIQTSNQIPQQIDGNQTNPPLAPEITPNIPSQQPETPETPQRETGFKDVIEHGRQKYEEWRNAREIPEKPKNRELKLQRGSSVLLPDGNLGEIEDVKQGIAKVKVGDKIRHKKLDELMESPKEAANAALELIKSFTPESKRSAHHALNTYDPVTKSAQFLFHNGDGYLVEDISPEEYEKLSNEIEDAKTTGENKIGAWATGSGSRGAAYQKIVKNLKKPYRKIQVGYNLFKEFQRLVNEKE